MNHDQREQTRRDAATLGSVFAYTEDDHEVRLCNDGESGWAVCTCGWESEFLDTRSAVESVAMDHAILHARPSESE